MNKRQQKKEVKIVLEDQVLPSDSSLEESVLGSIILDGGTINQIAQDFSPELFYEPKNKIIAEAVLSLYKQNKPIDVLTVIQHIKSLNKLEECGGAYYVSTLTNKSIGNINVQFHVKLLQQKSLERNLIHIANRAVVSIVNYKDDVFDVYAKTQSEIEASLKNILRFEIKSIQDIHHDILERNLNIIEKGIKSGVPSGFRNVDNVTNGWQKSDLIILAGRPSMGKALRNSSVVYTPNGFSQIGNVKVGEEIIGSDGQVYLIQGVYPQGERQIYKVKFDDGTFVDCCEEHLWSVSTRNDRKYGKKREGVQSILRTKQMLGNVTCSDGRNNYSINFCKPINFSKKEITIDPYLLGVFIGDGHSNLNKNSHTLRISNSEIDIIDKIKSKLPPSDELVYQSKYDYFIKRKVRNNQVSDTCKEIINIGLFDKKSFEKFIPKNYLYNSVDIRVELLQGLIDTDGFVPTKGRNAIEYSTTSKQLCEDVLELVRGLGGKATYKTKQGSYTKNGESIKAREYYRMYLSLPKEITPVSSKKHLLKYENKKQYHCKYITEIVKTDEFDEMTCISVSSPDKLFITDGYTLTHNTAAAVSLIIHPVLEKNIPVAIFSLEMSSFQIGSRIQSFISDINVSKIVKGQITMEEARYINASCEPLNKAPLYIDDTPNISLIELKSKARKLVEDKKVELIVIDYLQLMRSGLDIGSREQEIAEISRGLKALAKELNIPVIALSQLSRLVEARSDKKPMLSDLRESGQIEQDADMVVFCYRPEYYGIEQYEIGNQVFPSFGLMMLIIAKHRNGELGEIPLRFIHEQAKLSNYNVLQSATENNNSQSVNDSNKNSTFVAEEKKTNLETNTDFLNQKNDKDIPF